MHTKLNSAPRVYVIHLNWEEFHVPLLNEEILKNKNIHSFYKRNEKPWFDIQNLILKATAAVIDLDSIWLQADNKNRLIQSKDLVVRSIDTITLPGRLNQSIKIECKGRLKVSLSGACRNICGQDQINSKLFFCNDFAKNARRAQATYSLNQSNLSKGNLNIIRNSLNKFSFKLSKYQEFF